MQIKVKDTRMHTINIRESKTDKRFGDWDEVPVSEGKLVLVECKPEEALISWHSATGYELYDYSKEGLIRGPFKYLKPTIISETEKIEVGDWFYWKSNIYQCIRLQEDRIFFKDSIGNTYSCSQGNKILALPEHFSPKDLQDIVDGKMKDGCAVLVECDTLESLPPQYCISLNSSNHITLHKVEEKMYTFQEMEDVVMEFGVHWQNTKLPDGPVRFYFRKWFEQNVK